MEKLRGLGHLFAAVFLYGVASFMVVPAITDVTMSALCPGRDECSLAIYLSGIQQAVRTFAFSPLSLPRFLSSYVVRLICWIDRLFWFR